MKPKGRPKKCRIVKFTPLISQFSPRGKAGRPDETCLNLDELEAVRLADLSGFKQKECAEQMHVSQQTFSRILKKARKEIATAIVRGHAIKIHGGKYQIQIPKQNPVPDQK